MVKIISDSTCDLSAELLQKYNISVIPLSVNFGDEFAKDGKDATPQRIYDYVADTGLLPKTSACNVSEYENEFMHWKELGYEIVHISLGSKFSSTCQNAVIAAHNMDEVYVIDSANLSTGQGLLVVHAAEMAQKGASAKEIYTECLELVPKVETSFIISHLDYLYKGGRCSALSAFGANLLKIKPCIEVTDGEMSPHKKYRGSAQKAVLEYVTDRLSGRTDIDFDRIFITHTEYSSEAVDAVRKKIQELKPDFEEILETTAGSTITTHCGPECLGILFIRK
ncbi:MAG: DegV family protein [Oscillospiraceae bacterium]